MKAGEISIIDGWYEQSKDEVALCNVESIGYFRAAPVKSSEGIFHRQLMRIHQQ